MFSNFFGNIWDGSCCISWKLVDLTRNDPMPCKINKVYPMWRGRPQCSIICPGFYIISTLQLYWNIASYAMMFNQLWRCSINCDDVESTVIMLFQLWQCSIKCVIVKSTVALSNQLWSCSINRDMSQSPRITFNEPWQCPINWDIVQSTVMMFNKLWLIMFNELWLTMFNELWLTMFNELWLTMFNELWHYSISCEIPHTEYTAWWCLTLYWSLYMFNPVMLWRIQYVTTSVL